MTARGEQRCATGPRWRRGSRGPALCAAIAVLVMGACAPDQGGPEGGAAAAPEATIEWGLVVHGGAGTIEPEEMTPDLEEQYRAAMTEAMEAGHAVLVDGGSSLDAVVAAVTILEDSPLFNAGKGAVFTAAGTNALDASIMDGATLRAGAVAGVTTVKNPIVLARLVMEESPHVLLSGAGAEEFARLQGVTMVDPDYFHTERRWRQLEEAQAGEAAAGAETTDSAAAGDPGDARSFGTVGVVALDRAGNLAAGTSTGGTTNKKWGRVGDSPIVGAGTYAGPSCGVSGTGTGEYFIRNVVAHDICARVRYQGVSLAEAAHAVVMERLEAQAPDLGGVIALDGDGNVVMTFNTPGMYRGYIGPDGHARTALYR